MKNYEVTGYKMVKNPDTWDMERTGDLITVNISCERDNWEKIEGEISIKMDLDWFEAVAIGETN
jgi:hypothetical protein